MANIAVFGGTFNPFHIGHYEILKALCESDMLDRVLVVPDRIPPHKEKNNQATDDERIEMCRIVCEDFSKAGVCLIEFKRDGKSYTVDTINALKKTYPNDKFFVVCGADMIETLDTWHNFNELKSITKFIAFSRGENSLQSVEKMRSLGADIIIFDNKITEISSTQLRKNLKKEYLPKKVYDYVNKREIYTREIN